MIIKLALIENTSIIAFDARLNPGCTEKTQRQLALCMLKNIEKMQHKGIPIKKGLIRWELVSAGNPPIPPAILKGLGIRNPADRKRKGTTSQAHESIAKINSDSNFTGIKSQLDQSSHQASLGQINVTSLSEKGKKQEPNIQSSANPPQRVSVKQSQAAPRESRA